MELGQIAFGNPTGEYETPEHAEALIEYLFSEIDRVYWNREQEEWGRNYDPRIPGIVFRPYHWGDDEEASKPNFESFNQEIRWYKYPGRGVTHSKEMSEEEWIEWFYKTLEVIRESEK